MHRQSHDSSRQKAGEEEYQWSAASYQLGEIIENFELPVVAKVENRDFILPHDNYPPSFFAQSILLYNNHVIYKYITRHYTTTAGSNEARLSNEALILPQNYSGWFVHLKSSSNGTVTLFNSIEDVSQSNAAIFISKFGISGWNITSTSDDNWQYKKQLYSPGGIFRVDKACVGKVKVDVRFGFLSWKNKYKEIQYLKCVDSYSRSVLFPVEQKGTFFEILSVKINEDKVKLVLTNSELFTLPQTISPLLLIYGSKPFFVGFSGIIRLEKKFTDESIVGAIDVSKTTKRRNRLIELSTNSPITYHIALNSNDMMKRDIVGAVVKFCQRKGELFSRTIHVPYSLSLELPDKFGMARGEDVSEDD